MKLSIIVTNYKTPDLLKLCLESIKQAGIGLDYEIFVVDSEAQEETEDVIKEYFAGSVSLISFKENAGYARLVNAGLAKARGQYILVLNADMILFKDSLEKMLQYMEKNSKAGMLGPQLLNFNGSIQDSCFRFYRPMTILYRRTFLGRTEKGKADLAGFLMKNFNHQTTKEIDWLLGAALFIRAQAFKEVGPMDERYFLYFEDVDWCRRFHQAGWQVIYFPEAKMHHYHGRVSKKDGGVKDVFFNKYAWIHIASGIKYFWKYR